MGLFDKQSSQDSEDPVEKKLLLRKLRMPEKQRSQMTTEEQLANPEEGAHEQGWLETAEDALTAGKENLPAGSNASTLPFSKLELGAEKAASKAEGLFGKASKYMAHDDMVDAGNQLRVGRAADIFDEAGKLMKTIGPHSPEAQEFKQYARAANEAQQEAAPLIRKGDRLNGPTVEGAEPRGEKLSTLRDRGPKGEAKEFMEKTDLGISPIRKTAAQYMKEAQEVRSKQADDALQKVGWTRQKPK